MIPQPDVPDSLSYELPAVTISAPLKHNGVFSAEPVSVAAFPEFVLGAARVSEPKDLSLIAPNFIQADYGSKMTSSIYIRGIGARMENPAVGLYVDNIPILNKNSYDIDYFDVRQIYVLRGPQGTLYGRNTIGGVIDVHTLSPFSHQGTRVRAGYGNGNTSELDLSTYHKPTAGFGFSLSLSHRYTDGFFTNVYDGGKADRLLSEGARMKTAWRLNPSWTLENTLFANYVDQKGFAYALYDEQTGAVSPIDHNDPCAYERFNLTDGLTFRYDGGRVRFSSTTSYQLTDDQMTLDQDFRPEALFTLRQDQLEHALTQEFVLHGGTGTRWQRITGLFGFWKQTRIDSPVTFKRDGIDRLILAGANAGIHTVMPHANLQIEEDAFPIRSSFRLPAWGASLYHQSTWDAGRWRLRAGLRADYEHTAIKYDNSVDVSYRLTPMMPGYKPLAVRMDGRQAKDYFELMPQVSAGYNVRCGFIYVSVARGYKSGGYNNQIFSDILQNKLMSDMMEDMGVSSGGGTAPYDPDRAISYKPEYSWNYEVGAHLESVGARLNLDAALFYIDLRDQQLTVFPPGQTTGRMMSNAGRSRSYGAEVSLSCRTGKFYLLASYGYTNAKFIRYTSGDDDYSGKYVPYVPQNTVSAVCEYRQPLAVRWADDIALGVRWSGAGRIYWNETNTISQPFYGLLGASATLNMKRLSVSVWGENLADADYNTFYFRSMDNSFVQRGRPVRFGVTVDFRL